jgi:hypothetical protein
VLHSNFHISSVFIWSPFGAIGASSARSHYFPKFIELQSIAITLQKTLDGIQHRRINDKVETRTCYLQTFSTAAGTRRPRER